VARGLHKAARGSSILALGMARCGSIPWHYSTRHAARIAHGQTRGIAFPGIVVGARRQVSHVLEGAQQLLPGALACATWYWLRDSSWATRKAPKTAKNWISYFN
ncbi:hypothetical protein HAX54_008446, partial [Datura stramonium]|nr:hypothetical protein [Datura stramonium]